MMMFRRLYWVAEQFGENGRSKVTGVYTSIQDLIHKGLRWCDGNSGPNGFRLTLLKPDSFNEPLGVWESPRFNGLHEMLESLVANGEYNVEELTEMQQALGEFFKAKAS